jgi:RNA polymerase sigma-70 factor (ECF subfamily)
MLRLSISDVRWALGLLFTKPGVDPQPLALRGTGSQSGGRGAAGSPPSPSGPRGQDASDEQLMVAHTGGDAEAFAQLYRRYVQPLLRLMVRAQRSDEEARDLVQQTFLQLHRARADYDASRRFRPWLYAIARNVSREAFRKRQRRPTVSNDVPGTPEPLAESLAPEQIQVARAVRAAIEALPAYQREVIELHWFDGLTFTEIAQCLGVAANTAKVRAHRGYQSLRARLGDLMCEVTNRPPPA